MARETITDCIVGDVAATSRNALVGGPFGSDLVSRDYVPSGVPVIRGTNLGHGRWVDGDFVYVTPEKADSLVSNCAARGDLVFTQRGTLGQVALVPKMGAVRYLISQSQMKLTVDAEKADAMFLYYVFTSAEQQAYIRQNSIQTGVPHTNLGILRNTPLILPPLTVQKAIAHILGTLDDKIELNRRINETLEAMARAIFKNWFVDFDPVRAKMDGRKPEGMDAATAKLFPDEFEESELGPIPKGWKVTTLGQVAQNVSNTFDFSSNVDVVFVNTGDVLDGDFLHSNRSDPTGLPGQAKKAIAPDNILLSEIRPANKRFAYVDFDASEYVVSTKFMVIRGSSEIHSRLLYRILTSTETLTEFQIQAESRSGTFPQITFDSVSYLPIVLPPRTIQDAYQWLITRTDAHIKTNKTQSGVLAALRDTLLPKLLSGEILAGSVPKSIKAATR
ncbi:MAG: restriction endonuclease subunit S [Planctomycetota bacterium]